MRRLLKPQITLPLIVFCLSLVYNAFLSYLGNCDVWAMDCWSRWDSGLYIDIAIKGHNLVLCGPESGWPAGSGVWCGNAGWAPLYPFMMRGMHALGMEYVTAGWLLSRIFYLAFLLVMAVLIVKDYSLRNWMAMLLLVIAPGHIYANAIFPISLMMLLLALLFFFLLKQKWLAAGLVAGIAVWSYSTGFILILCLGFFALLYWKSHGFRAAFIMGLQLLIPPLLAFGGLLLYDHVATGHWNAMFLIQQKYGHSLQNPFKLMGMHWAKMLDDMDTLKCWVEFQNFSTILLVLWLVVYIMRKSTLALEYKFFFAGFALVFWFFPYSLSMDVSLYRNVALLSPLLFLIRDIPGKLQWILAIVWLALSVPLGILFIQSVIV